MEETDDMMKYKHKHESERLLPLFMRQNKDKTYILEILKEIFEKLFVHRLAELIQNRLGLLYISRYVTLKMKTTIRFGNAKIVQFFSDSFQSEFISKYKRCHPFPYKWKPRRNKCVKFSVNTELK